ncbi:MAG TPA: ubiquitin-like domain-containing protein [Propionibacteriaceae bacterium]|nr:ubiquitin-like domain-containing protein [Propionibacteriaceae bacterium]
MRRIFPAVAAGATALAVAGGTFGYVTLDKAVTLSIDGQVQHVQTMAPTVADLLENEKIEVGERDVIAPGLDSKLAEGTTIAVRYGREVTFNVDGKEQAIWTTATTVDQAVDALAVDLAGAELSPGLDTAIGREGLDVDIATAKTVSIDAAGKKRKVTTTAQTVAGALQAAKIVVDGNDKLSVRPTARLVDGASFRYIRVSVSALTKKVTLAHKTVRKETEKLDRGDTKVDTKGRAGIRSVTYRVVRHNGKTVSKTQTGSKITKKPVTEVVLVGTKEKVQKPTSSGAKKSSGSTPASGSVWDRLAQCESGGNWSINSGNGYYGGLQFSLGTWRAYGGSGYPHQNSRAQQIAIGQKLQAAAGWGQWPACSSKLGLR